MIPTPFAYRWLALAALTALLGAACSGSSNGGDQADAGTDPNIDDSECVWSEEFSEFFPANRVVQIEIDFDDPDAWEQMLAQKMDEIYMSATVTIDGESMTDVGVRFKGNSSLQMSETQNTKSLKIHFEEYVDGQRFRCVDRLNLNNAFKDPSMMRETLAYELSDAFGIPTPRTAFAELHVDGELHGLFTMVQQVDHRFLKDVYGEEDHADDGNLYKLYSDYDFGYLGPDATAADYGDSVAETGLVLKTNEDDPSLNDFADVTALTEAIADVLADPSDDNRAALEAVMDIDGYLRYQAWTLAISNLDAYYSMFHNLYIYHHPVTGRFETIPWDVNEAFGAFPCMSGPPGPDNPPGDVYAVDLQTPCGADEQLNKLSYMVPEYEDRYCEFLHEFVDVADISGGGLYNIGGQDSRIAELHELIGEARQRMEDEGVLSQPPGEYTYQDYLTNQTHQVSDDQPEGPGEPGPGPNLGYFNDERLGNLAGQIVDLCGG